MKVGYLSRSMQWWVPSITQCIGTKANNSGLCQNKKSQCLTTRCHVSLRSCFNYSLTTTSHAIHKSTYCLLRHPTLHEGQPWGHWSLGYRVTNLYWMSQLIWGVFYEIQVWRKCRSLCYRFNSLQQLFPNDAGALSAVKMKLGLGCSYRIAMTMVQWINNVIQVVSTFH